MKIKDVEINKIEWIENIRQNPIDGDLSGLMQSIKQNGILHPIGIKEVKGGYLGIYGFRRWSACKKLDWKTIPAVCVDVSDELTDEELIAINISENLHRKSTNMIELGRVCSILRKTRSIDEVSIMISCPKKRVITAIEEFNKIPEKFRNKVVLFDASTRSHNKNGNLGSTIAYAILQLRNITKEQRDEIFEWARKEEITRRQIDILTGMLKSGIDLKTALNNLNKTKIICVVLSVNKERYEKLKIKNASKFVRNLLNKKYPRLCF